MIRRHLAGVGGGDQVQRCGVIRYRNGEAASTNLAGFLLKVDNAERNVEVQNQGLVERAQKSLIRVWSR